MANSIDYIRKQLPSYTMYNWFSQKERLIRDWIPLVKGDYKGLLEVYSHCSSAKAPKDIINQLLTEIISACPTVDDFWNLLCTLDEKYEKALFLKGISLCQTDSELDDIEGYFENDDEKDEDILKAIKARRDELSQK